MNRLDPDASMVPPDPAAPRRDLPAGPARPRRSDAAVSRSFVVEVTTGQPDDFRGRVQHLATHDGGNFTSVEMLVSIIRRVLERGEPDEPGEG